MKNNEWHREMRGKNGMKRRQRRNDNKNAKINVYIATSLCHFE